MLVLIDESGCAGFKFAKGSSPYFIVAMVIFDDFVEAEKTSTAIRELRDALSVKPEFRFNKCCDRVRNEFFKMVTTHKFRVQAIIVDKAKIYNDHLRSNPNRFYNYFIQMLVRHDGGTIKNASVKIDGRGDREFKRALESYLRTQLAPGKITKLRFIDSKKDDLVQLADMVVGAIARSYSTRANAARWRRMIQRKLGVWEFK